MADANFSQVSAEESREMQCKMKVDFTTTLQSFSHILVHSLCNVIWYGSSSALDYIATNDEQIQEEEQKTRRKRRKGRRMNK